MNDQSLNAADTPHCGQPQAQVAVGNVFKRGAWWQRLAGGRRDFTFGICAPDWLILSQSDQPISSSRLPCWQPVLVHLA